MVAENSKDQVLALPSIKYDDGGEERIIFTLPPALNPNLDSVLYFTVPKAGTILLSGIMAHLSHYVGLRLVYIEGEYFKLGIPADKAPATTSAIFRDKGYCYGSPFVPVEYEIPILGRAKAILLVRDPRDALVSLYYSVRNSHPEPGNLLKSSDPTMPGRDYARCVGVDDFVVSWSEEFANLMGKYRERVVLGQLKTFRYEDVIYDKAAWVADICSYFGWDIPAQKHREIAAEFDVFPKTERPDQHVRQVHPGNYRSKLSLETIRWIENRLSDDMAFFGYHRHSPGVEIG